MNDQTPIERAGSALTQNRAYMAGIAFGVPLDAEARHRSEIVKAAFDSIDAEELAAVLHGDQCPEDPDPDDYCTCDAGHYDRLALAVKNWLTGKDTQQ